MSGRPWVDDIRRDAPVVVATGLAGGLLAAAIDGWRAATEQRYWESGYLRLVSDCVWERFDRWTPVALGVALVLVVVARLVVRRPTRLPVRASVALVLLIGGLRALAAADAWRAGEGPNVVLISVDTLRADRLGAYGYALPTSPVIDRRLAGEGVTFEEAYSQSPKTTPSHMTMLTALYPSVHGVELWEQGMAGHVLNPAVHTLAEVLKDAGYATAAFTGGTNVHRARGFDQGFDVFKHGQQLERTLAWIGRHRRRKFFVFFHTYAVHDPYVPPVALVRQFAPDYDGPVLAALERLRAGVAGWPKAHHLFWAAVDTKNPRDVELVSRLYDAGIRNMDDTVVTPLLDRLAALGLDRRTLVVFTSDHGEAFGEHGGFMHGDLFAGTLHVPLILRFPGVLPAGARVRGRARLLDLTPTVLDLLGLRPPAEAEGRSLVPAIHATSSDVDTVVSEYSTPRLEPFESLRRGSLTYIVAGADEQLFDVDADPGEHENLTIRRPADLEAMRATLARWHEESRALAARLGPRTLVHPDAGTLEQLRALGYVE